MFKFLYNGLSNVNPVSGHDTCKRFLRVRISFSCWPSTCLRW